MPIISICLITYNRKKYLKEAIDSVLAQSFHDWEFIIIDNGSTDNSVDNIINQYVASDSRIKLYINYDNNIPYSRNLALSKCSGKYIAIIDSDDIWCDNNKLYQQYTFLNNNPDYVLVGGWGTKIDEEGEFLEGNIKHPLSNKDIKNTMLVRNNFIHSSVMYIKDRAVECGGYDTYTKIATDYDLWLKLGKYGSVANMPKYFVKYRFYDGNIRFPRIKRHILIAKIVFRYRKDYSNYLYSLLRTIFIIIFFK
jgi:glycosyltransferase involved in cell wall biosynthesis